MILFLCITSLAFKRKHKSVLFQWFLTNLANRSRGYYFLKLLNELHNTPRLYYKIKRLMVHSTSYTSQMHWQCYKDKKRSYKVSIMLLFGYTFYNYNIFFCTYHSYIRPKVHFPSNKLCNI